MSDVDKTTPNSLNDDVLATAMKSGMRHLASGVALMATRDARGEAQGMTVTAVNSLSDQPPSLLVCLNRSTSSLRALKESKEFSINLLNANQRELSEKFAFSAEGESRFSFGQWLQHGDFSPPYLQDALVSFFCHVDRFIDYGSHCIVIGCIEEVLAAEDREPLIYYDGGYRTLR